MYVDDWATPACVYLFVLLYVCVYVCIDPCMYVKDSATSMRYALW
jgi:hypothetical protein